jgi:FAD/FMN-containing dehydrogenase
MVAGDVFAPGDRGYERARQAWDLAVDQRPEVVVFAESVVDVVRAVRFARSQGLRIAPQGTGHGAMPLEPLEDAMLLRTSRIRRVDIFPTIHTARAEAGAQWEDVTVPAGEYGLAALAGTSPNVGVTRYTLGSVPRGLDMSATATMTDAPTVGASLQNVPAARSMTGCSSGRRKLLR